MREIYRRANHVLCWLGLADKNTKLASVSRGLFKNTGTLGTRSLHALLILTMNYCLHLMALNYFAGDPTGFESGLSKEITVANTITVCCGNNSIECDTFVGLLKLVGRRSDEIGLLIAKLMDRGKAELPWGVIGGAQSTDPRDLLYGLAGFDSGGDQMEINYSLPVAQIYTDFAKTEIVSSHRLDILTRIIYPKVDGTRISQHNLPSWVPDWSLHLYNSMRPHFFFREIYNKRPMFTASKRNLSEFFFKNNSSILVFKGVQIDLIESPGSYPGMKIWAEYPRAVLALQAWWELLHTESSNEKIPSSRQIAFVRFLLVDEIMDDDRFEAQGLYSSLLGHIAKLSREYHPHHAVDCTLVEYSELVVTEDTGWLLANFKLICWKILNRRFCISAAGTLCLVPEVAREGDIICLPLGCSHPIVLRAIEDHYIVLGEAYADGWMYGKAVDELEKGNMQLRDFEIW